jgi:uncharacterized lipoprotein YehR (DUF1307 family)
MKKLLTVLIMSIVALSLAACGEEKPTDSSASNAPAAQSTPDYASMK